MPPMEHKEESTSDTHFKHITQVIKEKREEV